MKKYNNGMPRFLQEAAHAFSASANGITDLTLVRQWFAEKIKKEFKIA